MVFGRRGAHWPQVEQPGGLQLRRALALSNMVPAGLMAQHSSGCSFCCQNKNAFPLDWKEVRYQNPAVFSWRSLPPHRVVESRSKDPSPLGK